MSLLLLLLLLRAVCGIWNYGCERPMWRCICLFVSFQYGFKSSEMHLFVFSTVLSHRRYAVDCLCGIWNYDCEWPMWRCICLFVCFQFGFKSPQVRLFVFKTVLSHRCGQSLVMNTLYCFAIQYCAIVC